jgi:glycosyltransferase involved in cell wall biosynthesis
MKSKSKLHSVAVIIPALDEEVGIARVLDALDRDLIDTIIVCDNGSRDATAERARERGAVVVHEERRGYGSACLCALSVLPKETSIVAFIDADFSDDPRELVDILTPIVNDEADLVIGSRVARAERDALTPTQRFGNAFATRLMRIFLGGKFSDLGPFRAITRPALDALDMSDRGMGWTVEMQLKALRRALRCREVDVSYRPRRAGRSKVSGSLRGVLRAGSKITWLVLRHGLFGK